MVGHDHRNFPLHKKKIDPIFSPQRTTNKEAKEWRLIGKNGRFLEKKDHLIIQEAVKEADPLVHLNTPCKELVVSGFHENVNEFEDENENEDLVLEEVVLETEEGSSHDL
ncbi:hypothetical protein KI387_002078 [Taxus chinensis]|uniref:Uncharacterized protein n=1 Tax=Taxus chinensis TaxID=29808 RepID=A0AA38H0I5_TAXCH|nr:hypothetical protein KI387_002078 [Taxus chinensis]